MESVTVTGKPTLAEASAHLTSTSSVIIIHTVTFGLMSSCMTNEEGASARSAHYSMSGITHLGYVHPKALQTVCVFVLFACSKN